MKLNTAFKLSALAVALASTSTVFASTLDTSELNNDTWTDPRGTASGNIDQSAYQYVDVGSAAKPIKESSSTQGNNLTSWYTVTNAKGESSEVIKIEQDLNGVKDYKFYDATGLINKDVWLSQSSRQVLNTLNDVEGKISVELADGSEKTLDLSKYYTILTVPESDLNKLLVDEGLNMADIKAIKTQYENVTKDKLEASLIPTNLGGVTGNKFDTSLDVKTIKRLDSEYLEYAERTTLTETSTKDFGNLTDKNIDDPKVWLTIDTKENSKQDSVYDRGVISGIINTEKKGSLAEPNKYIQYFGDLLADESEAVTNNVYGLVASEVKTVKNTNLATGNQTESVEIDRYTALTQAGVVVADDVKKTQTVITAEGITTGKLTLSAEDGGLIDVGQALGNAAILGDLSSQDINNLVNSGQELASLGGRVTTIETDVVELEERVTKEVVRLDGRIDSKLVENTTASTKYTDEKATQTLDLAKEEDAKSLIAAQDFAKAEDLKTLSSANSYTDVQVANVNSRVNQLNSKIDDVEKTAYRGVAIALAAQQQVPNIKPGQFAVFGGVGHYEGESAGALGLVGAINERTSMSAAIGVAGGSEVGGRVGVAYVFGGK